MDMDGLDAILKFLPPKYAAPAALVLVGGMIAGRVYHALVNQGGITGVWRSIVCGSVNVTPPAAEKSPVEPQPNSDNAKVT